MKLNGVLETGVYVDDMARARDFYERMFELEPMVADARFCAYGVACGSVLLLFLRGGTMDWVELPGGRIPPHDGYGQNHFAFAVDAASLPAWEQRLADHKVEILSRVTWPLGGVSIYFHDPDGHMLELATPGVWRVY